MLLPAILYGAESKSSYTSINDTHLIKTALLNGFSGVDSAVIYAEKDAGHALKQSNLERSQIWIQSKFTPITTNILPYNITASIHDQVIQSFHWSLNSLQTEYLDSYLLHCPSGGSYRHIIKKDLQIWQELEALRSEGLVRQIGISGISLHSLKQLVDNTKIKPAIVQNFAMVSNLVSHNTEAQTLEYCLENAIAYQPVNLLNRHRIFLNHQDIIDIANSHNATTGQVLIKFAQLVGMTPVLGTTQEKHMQEAISLNFDLSYDEVHVITKLLPASNQMFSIYLRLQNGDLLTQRNIVDSIINSDAENLESDLSGVLKYIPKIDPSTLAAITGVVDIRIIHFLKDNGARFDLLNNIEYSNLINSRSVELMDELDIRPNKTTADTESTIDSTADETYSYKAFSSAVDDTNSTLFDSIIRDIRNGILSEYWAEAIKLTSYFVIRDIINKYPDVAIDLIKAGANGAWVLQHLSALENTSYFDDIINNIKLDPLDNFAISGIMINKCRFDYEGFYANYLLIPETYKIESLSDWQQQKEAINKIIHCCQEQQDSAMILECYGKQGYESDEL